MGLRIVKISWVDKFINAEVLERMNKEMELLLTVQRSKLEFLGNISRNVKYQLLQFIVQGKIEGKRTFGRRRILWPKYLRERFNGAISNGEAEPRRIS